MGYWKPFGICSTWATSEPARPRLSARPASLKHSCVRIALGARFQSAEHTPSRRPSVILPERLLPLLFLFIVFVVPVFVFLVVVVPVFIVELFIFVQLVVAEFIIFDLFPVIFLVV